MDEKTNLLVIDDEEAICTGVMDMLKKEAFDIAYRLSGEEGLEYLKHHMVDIVLLDINLGQGINGIDALKRIKSEHTEIEVIMLTGEKAPDTIVDCVRNGAFDYMTKPFDKAHFLEKVNDAAASKKYNKISEKDRDGMLRAMAAGVNHQFNNRLSAFVFERDEIMLLLNEAKQLCAAPGGEKNLEISEKLKNALKVTEQLSENIAKTKNIVNSVSGYDNIIAEKEKYSFMFVETITDLAVSLLKLNNKLEESPVKTVNVINNTFYGNKAVILEVVYGCLQNAYEAVEHKRKYLNEAGKAKNPPEIILTYTEMPHCHIIEIKDNGTGIKEADKNKIFAPYFTTKASSAPGLGSGLFVMKKMMEEKHRGRLIVESEYGKGTTVKIEIPKEFDMQTVIVIDDEKDIVELTTNILLKRGFIAISAQTREEGIQKFKEVNPVCVFLDMNLKGITDGGVVLKQLLEIDPKACVYIMTGNATIDEDAARKMGAKGFISKPAKIEDMIKKYNLRQKKGH